MPYVPPWEQITPEFFINAMRSGAEAGTQAASTALKRRSIDQQALEASGRLGLGYAELGQRAQEAGSVQQEAAAKLRAAMAQQSGLQQYRDQLEENRTADNTRADAALQLARDRGDLSAQREQRLGDTAEENLNKPKVFSVGLDVVKYDPESGKVEKLYRGKPASGGRFSDLLESIGGGTGGGQPQELPKEKSALKKGGVYNTRHGPAIWDGDKFVPQKTATPEAPAADAFGASGPAM